MALLWRVLLVPTGAPGDVLRSEGRTWPITRHVPLECPYDAYPLGALGEKWGFPFRTYP